MKVSELFEAVEAKDVGTLEIIGDGDQLTLRSTAKSGPMIGGLYWVWKDIGRKKGVKTSMMVGQRFGSPRPVELTANDGLKIIDKRPTKLMFSGISKDDLQAAATKAIEKVQKTMKADAKYKADAPKRKAEASKFASEQRKKDMAEYDKKYGKGTWKRVTYRQEGGDDGYAYVVRVDGRPKWNGLTQREAMHYKEQEVDALAKAGKLGKYAEKAVTEARKPKVQKDYSPLGQLKELPQPIGINGGSYTYWVDVTKTPLKFTASDGSEVDEAKSLEDIKGWMAKWAAEIWQEFLDGEESLELLRDEGIIRIKKGRTDQQDHEASMRG